MLSEELLQSDGDLTQPLCFGRGAAFPPKMIPVVLGQSLNDRREVRRQAAPPLEGPQHPIIVLNELEHDPGGEVLSVLSVEPGLPAGKGDELLNERPALEEELVGGEVGRRGGGRRGHRSDIVAQSEESRHCISLPYTEARRGELPQFLGV